MCVSSYILYMLTTPFNVGIMTFVFATSRELWSRMP